MSPLHSADRRRAAEEEATARLRYSKPEDIIHE